MLSRVARVEVTLVPDSLHIQSSKQAAPQAVVLRVLDANGVGVAGKQLEARGIIAYFETDEGKCGLCSMGSRICFRVMCMWSSRILRQVFRLAGIRSSDSSRAGTIEQIYTAVWE